MIGAFLYGVGGYMTDLHANNAAFNGKSFLKTLLISAVVGFIQVQTGLGYQDALTAVTTNTIVVYVIDKIINAVSGINVTVTKAAPTPAVKAA